MTDYDYLAIARKIGEPILAEYPNSKNGDVFYSRRFSGVVTKGIELVMVEQADAASAVAQAKAIHKISDKQWAVVAGWIREAAERIVAAVAENHNASRVRKKKGSAGRSTAANLSNGDPVKKKRGRPPKGERALTSAEHQRAYRQRLKDRAAPNKHAVDDRRARIVGVVEEDLWRVYDRLDRLEAAIERNNMPDVRAAQADLIFLTWNLARAAGYEFTIPFFFRKPGVEVTISEVTLLPDMKVPWKTVADANRSSSLQPAPEPAPKTPALPKGLRRIEDAVRMDVIICLEDGKAVQDLASHLASIGMTPDSYREKWNLPPEYPMQAPNHIRRHGAVFEVDADNGRMRKVREVTDNPQPKSSRRRRLSRNPS